MAGGRAHGASAGHHQGSARRQAVNKESYVPFGAVLRSLLLEHGYTTPIGNPNWRKFADSLDDVHYETLRKAVVGERWPAVELMRKIAAGLDVQPDVFVEYQMWESQQQFDPREVGPEQAFDNLLRWRDAQGK